MILAGDIGGTSTRLALFDRDRQPHDVREYSSQKYPGLADVIAEYLGVSAASAADSPMAKGRFDRACFGVAGPVESGPNGTYVRGTNLSWSVSQADLAKTFGLPRESVGVINDLAANATGVAEVAPENLVTLQAGEQVAGHRAIISAGTGLGEGGLFWDGKDHHPIPSEGGHSSFGPRNELEDGLLRYLRGKETQAFRGHVSFERVLSGPGIYNVFDYLRHAGVAEQKLQLDPEMKPGDAAKLISKAALDNACPRGRDDGSVRQPLRGGRRQPRDHHPCPRRPLCRWRDRSKDY